MKKVLTLILITLSIAAFAQENIELEEVMVTASANFLGQDKTGRSVEIITGDQISALPVSTIDEVLRYVAGMNINQRGAFGVQSDIGMRGSTFSQVLVLLDNVRLNDPLTAHFNSNIPVSISEVHHIEITRGPASASFGGDAVGGVINIITKTYATRGDGNSLKLIGDVNAGQHKLRSTDVGGIVHRDKLAISASARTSSAFGEELVNPNFLADISEDSLYNNDFDLQTYTGSASYRFSNNFSAYARVGFDDRDFNAKYFYTRSAYDESRERTKNLWSQFALRFNAGDHMVELNGGFKQLEDHFEFNPLFTPNEHTTRQGLINLTHTINAYHRGKITYGGQFISKSIESTDRGNHEDIGGGVFAMYSNNFIQNLFVNTSMRIEYDEVFGVEFLPQASVSYKLNRALFRASYGRSIRSADYTERFVSYNISELSPGRNAGNPDLQAEISNSADLGVQLDLPNDLRVSSTVFVRQSSDLIDFSLRNADDIDNLANLMAGEEYFYADNVSDTQVLGVELSIWKGLRIGSDFRATGELSYTFLETSTADGALSKYISNHPKNNVSLQLNSRYKIFQVSGTVSYIVRQNELSENVAGEIMGEYVVANALASCELTPGFRIYSQVFNLTNTKYQEILGAQLPGRWMSFGFKWNITAR